MELILRYILVSTLVGFLLAPPIISLLYRYGVFRKSETDFSHLVEGRYLKAGTPIMGGTIVILTILLVTTLFNLNGVTIVPLIVLTIAALLGGVDDLLNIFGRKRLVRPFHKQMLLAKVHKQPIYRLYYLLTLPWNAYKNIWFALGSYPGNGIHAGEKILVQVVAGFFVAWWIYLRLGWTDLWIPLIGTIQLGFLMPFFIIFTVVALSNAVNISDGMDGLSTGLMLPSFMAFMLIAIDQEVAEIALLCAATIGALFTYLYFNIKPARIEMGDVGTLGLGTLMAAIAFALDVPLLIPIIGFPFVLIIGSSLIQGVYRRIFGRKILKMAPIHLHFQIVGWPEEKVVMRAWLFGILCALVGLWLYTIPYHLF